MRDKTGNFGRRRPGGNRSYKRTSTRPERNDSYGRSRRNDEPASRTRKPYNDRLSYNKRRATDNRKSEESRQDKDTPRDRKPQSGRSEWSNNRNRSSESGRFESGNSRYSERRFTDKKDGYRKPISRERRSDDKPYSSRNTETRQPDRREGRYGERRFSDRRDRERKPFGRDHRTDDRPYSSRYNESRQPDRRENRYSEHRFNGRQNNDRKTFRRNDEEHSIARKKNDSSRSRHTYSDKPSTGKRYQRTTGYEKPVVFNKDSKPYNKQEKRLYNQRNEVQFTAKSGSIEKEQTAGEELIRLNRFISNSGLCSRREADDLIKAGVITVNGKIVTLVGTKVKITDDVRSNGEPLHPERKVYILLNKPKDYVTTVDDPHARHTVMELIAGACPERVYPVGRLDRNTTGVLLFTNDGEMTKKLTHPSYQMKKIYHVVLNRNVKPDDLRKLVDGVTLDDGHTVSADEVSYVNEVKSEVGIEIHSGENRVVRRMFESLGYEVAKLDRVYFAGLTKKNIERGKWRFLTPKEINLLKMSQG